MSIGFGSLGIQSTLSAMNQISAELVMSNYKLSTGYRVNRASDDPAAMVASTLLQSDISRLTAQTENGQEIISMLDTADDAMGQIASLLGVIQSSTDAASGSSVTASDLAAYQSQIDAAINQIDSIAQSTSFGGIRLLNGGLGYHASGIDASKIASVRIYSADTASSNPTLNVQVTGKAERAELSFDAGSIVNESFEYADQAALQAEWPIVSGEGMTVSTTKSYSGEKCLFAPTAYTTDFVEKTFFETDRKNVDFSIQWYDNNAEQYNSKYGLVQLKAADGTYLNILNAGSEMAYQTNSVTWHFSGEYFNTGWNTVKVSYDETGAATVYLNDAEVDTFAGAKGLSSIRIGRGWLTGTNLNTAWDDLKISDPSATLMHDVTFTLTGPEGLEDFSFAAGTTMSEIEDAVNAVSDSLGVEASYEGGTMYFRSLEYGSDQTVRIDVTSGTLEMNGGITENSGTDPTVTVNGKTASTDGQSVYYSSGATSARLVLQESFASTAGGSTSFTLSGGGESRWQIDSNTANKISFGLPSLKCDFLGDNAIGTLSSLKNGGAFSLSSGKTHQASNIVSSAIRQLSSERIRLSAVKTYAVGSTMSSLSQAQSAMSESVSHLIGIDQASQTAESNRLQLLMNMGSQILSGIYQYQQHIFSLL